MKSTADDQLATSIHFRDEDDGLAGHDEHGRYWRILEERTGWRLSFRDPGDDTATNAGVFGSLAAAQAEALGHRRR